MLAGIGGMILLFPVSVFCSCAVRGLSGAAGRGMLRTSTPYSCRKTGNRVCIAASPSSQTVSYTHLFEEQHRAELTAHRAAAAYFKANDITKLPSPKKLEAEYAQLASEKAKFYEQYKESKEELLKLKTAKQNVVSFFREEEQTQQER